MVLLGCTQLNDDPLPPYCRSGFCTTNKSGIYFPDLNVEHDLFSKITRCPPLTCQHVSQKVKVEQLGQDTLMEAMGVRKSSAQCQAPPNANDSWDWEASQESCSVILVKAWFWWYACSRPESWHNRSICKKMSKVEDAKAFVYTDTQTAPTSGFLLLASAPLCNSNLRSRRGSTYSDTHQTCSQQWVKHKQRWAILCVLQWSGLVPHSCPGPDLPGQIQTQLGVLTWKLHRCSSPAHGKIWAGSKECQGMCLADLEGVRNHNLLPNLSVKTSILRATVICRFVSFIFCFFRVPFVLFFSLFFSLPFQSLDIFTSW